MRKRLSVLVSAADRHIMITKGALPNVLSVCATADTGARVADSRLPSSRIGFTSKFDEFSIQGFRTVGLAYRDLGTSARISKDRRNGYDVPGISCVCRSAEGRNRGHARAVARSRHLAQDHHRGQPFGGKRSAARWGCRRLTSSPVRIFAK